MNELENIQVQQLSQVEKAEKLVKLERLKKEVTKALDEIKQNLLEEMQRLDVVSLKTGSYTLTRSTRQTMKIVDQFEAKKSLEAANVEVVMKTEIDMDYMKPALKELLKKGRIDGVEETKTDYVSVRVKEQE